MDTLLEARAKSVTASLNYLAPMAESPVSYTFEPPPGTPWRTGESAPHWVQITDGRPFADRLSLDLNGFALVRDVSAVADFHDERALRAVYLPEAERLVREVTGARRVIAFDHNLRHGESPDGGANGIKPPVKRVHNDFTVRSGPRRAADEIAARGEQPSEALKGRFAIVNVWRPIRGPVEEQPLAACDARSIAPADLVRADLVYRDRVGETYSVTFNAAHRWFYFPRMTRDEALLIKVFDSAEDGRARFSAHSAFEDPATPPGAAPRESIEVRTLAIF